MDAFLAIENILHFHHTTSRQPMRVALLRLRCFQNGSCVSQADIDTILRVWPAAYRIYISRGNLVIEATDLPQKVNERRITFASLWKEKENLLQSTSELAEKSTTEKQNAQNRFDSEPVKPSRPILMGRMRKQPVNRSLSLLDRIRAKEATLREERSPLALQRTQDSFLRSQLPRLKRVLEGLAESDGRRSIEMQEVMDILRTNLYKLGDDEIKRVLHLIIQTYPTLCSIVTVGSATHVQLNKAPSVVC